MIAIVYTRMRDDDDRQTSDYSHARPRERCDTGTGARAVSPGRKRGAGAAETSQSSTKPQGITKWTGYRTHSLLGLKMCNAAVTRKRSRGEQLVGVGLWVKCEYGKK